MIVSQENFAHGLAERLGGEVHDIEPIRRGMAHRMLKACWQQGENITPIVLRFFGGPRAFEDARIEADALRELGRDCYPVPELHLLVDEEDAPDAPFIVMQQLEGEPLTQIALSHPETISYWLDKASDLLLKLHGLNWQRDYETFKPVLSPLDFAERQLRWWARQAASVQASGIEEGFAWLRAHLYRTREVKQQSLVHRDFHSDNILSDGKQITGVVDWGELTIADPAVDVGWTRMILATEAGTDLGDLFTADYARRNPDILETLAFWEMFAACKRLTTIAAVKAHQSERLSMWANAPELPRLEQAEVAVRQFMQERLSGEDSD